MVLYRVNVCMSFVLPDVQDFDLCLACYDTTKHEHPMERLGLGMIDPEDQDPAAEQDPQVHHPSYHYNDNLCEHVQC